MCFQGTITVLSLARLRAAIAAALGEGVGQVSMLLTALQFHLPFYASRPLPNTFALAVSSLAHADWISMKRPQRAIVLMAIAVVRHLNKFPDSKCVRQGTVW
jgi:alpha-1,6-mannosyltransferase